MSKEIWDAYDKDGNKLGFDQFRDEPIPEGVYHIVVEIYTITENKEVLITQRHPNHEILRGETHEIQSYIL